MKKKQGLSALGEFGLIEAIRRMLPLKRGIPRGIGDDTAVLPFDRRTRFLFTVDAIVEKVDFFPGTPYAAVGRKALAVNLSDIAAMGGFPLYAVVSLGLTPRTKPVQVREFYRGMRRLADQTGVAVVGGDISRSTEFFASVAVIGRVEKDRVVARDGARRGDHIFVTGRLGGTLRGKHLAFQPRLREARVLVTRFKPHAMIDVSDGVLQDLGHVLKESCVGARIFLDRIPVAAAARRSGKSSALKNALCGGEDFELLFTVSPAEARKVLALKNGLAGTPVHCIGRITAGRRLIIQKSVQDTGEVKISWKGYRHF